MKREKWIDNAKGIAMLLVILGHVSTELTGLWDFQFVYGIHLTAFFILSGYTLKKKKISRKYLNAKFTRLMVPYFYTCLAVMLMDVFNCWKLNHDISSEGITRSVSKDLLLSFIGSGSIRTFGAIEIGARIGAIWFLPAMFFAVLIFQYLLGRTENDKLLGLMTAVTALAGFITAKFLWLPFSIQSGMLASFFIWIGYEIRKHSLLEKIRWHHYLAAQVTLLFGIYHGYCGISFAKANLNDLFLSVPVGLSGCLLIYLFSIADEKGYVLSYIGRISLTVLCVHLFALNTLSQHFRLFLDKTSLSGNRLEWAFILMHFTAAVLGASFIEILKKKLSPLHHATLALPAGRMDAKHDLNVDIAKGIFILALLAGQFTIDTSLRKIIFSCCGTAFIVFYGYFYRKDTSFFCTLKCVSMTLLLPYALSSAAQILLECCRMGTSSFRGACLRYLMGMSGVKNILTGIPSIGMTGFLLMLFEIRLLYAALDRWKAGQFQLTISAVCISVAGLTLGKEGWWLPWSLDIAFYAMIFYHIGVLFRRYKILEFADKWNISYFITAPVWAYMIFSGSMELSSRNYGDYGVVLLGSLAGIILVYMLSAYLGTELPVLSKVLGLAGKNTLYILIVHELAAVYIHSLAGLRFRPDHAAFLIFGLLLEAVSGIIFGEGISFMKRSLFIKKTQ